VTVWLAILCSLALGIVQFKLCIRHLEGDAVRSDQMAALAIALLTAVPPVMAANGLFLEPFVAVFMVILGAASGMGFVNAGAMQMTFGDRRRADAIRLRFHGSWR
jgi:hypothetical protein